MKKHALLQKLGFSDEFLKQLDDYKEPNDVQISEEKFEDEEVGINMIETTELKWKQKQASSSDFHYQS